MRSFERPLRSLRRWVLRITLHASVGLLLAMTAASPTAAQSQSSDEETTPATILRDAQRAFRSGQYDKVDELTAPIAASLGDAALVRARAAIARGRYDAAIGWLKPLAASDRGGPAALDLGLLQLSLGRRAEAEPLLQAVVQRASTDADGAKGRGARAAHALGRVQLANDLFRDAAAMAGDDAELQTAWGDLLVEKHQNSDAGRSYRAAIQADRGYAPAYVGLGRAMLEDNPPVARQLAGRALMINPWLESGHVLIAELALNDRDLSTASTAVAKALETNPSSLDARALEAAIAWLQDRTQDFETLVQAALAINPRFGAIYRVAGTHAARHYRFEEAVALTRKGLAIDSDDTRAYAELGLHLLRTGDEPEARAVLERAFRDDPYDVVTYNLLGLLDTLDTFETIQDGQITMRLHRDEAAVLREHAMPLAQLALHTLGERYGVTPKGPILIEIFPRHDDFAVRNLGLPGMIGALGACFGRVVTVDSPKARPPGTFNWQATLWHELAHVITLQLSQQRVPRWLTEGISEYEEQRARPEWGRQMQMEFAETMERGDVVPLAQLNEAFSDPERISLAYYQASLVVQHIVAAHGEEGLRRLLVAFGRGLDTEAAVQETLGVPVARLQETFTAFLDERFAPLRAALTPPEDDILTGQTSIQSLRELAAAYPKSYPVQLAAAQVLQEAGEVDEAMRLYEAADALVPVTTGDESPLTHVAKLAEDAGNRARASAALERLLLRDGDNIGAARKLVELLDSPGDADRLLRAQTRVAELDPFDAAAHTAIGRQALADGDVDVAVRWFRVALAAGARDPVAAHTDLAEAYWRGGARAEARHQTLAALELAPTYARAQDLLLAIVDGAK
jgi:tetratricopeptide (TPR) repeat protein